MIVPSQGRNLQVKPRWVASVGVMESVLAYNCRKYGMPCPVLAMPFWEAAGNQAIDLSGYGYHGDLQSTTSWVVDGLDFNGSSDYVQLPQILDSPTEVSWSVRFKSDVSNTTEQRLIAYNNDGVFFLTSINGGTANLIRTYISPAGWSDTTTSYDVTEWHNIVGTVKENDSLELYVDGTRIGDGLATGTFTMASGLNRVIGCGRSLDTWSNGIIDIPIIYNTVLTATQIKFLYDNPYFMYRMPEELYGYTAAAPPTGNPTMRRWGGIPGMQYTGRRSW